MRDITLSVDLLQECAIPRKFWALGADTYSGSAKALAQADAYVKHSAKNQAGAYVYGPSGTYKTFLLTYILRCLLAQGSNVMYANMKDLPGQLFGEDSAEFRQQCFGCSFIAVDDVVEPTSPNAFKGISRFFSWCRDNQINLILASQFTPVELADCFGKEIANWLHEDVHRNFEIKCSVDEIAKEILRCSLARKKYAY